MYRIASYCVQKQFTCTINVVLPDLFSTEASFRKPFNGRHAASSRYKVRCIYFNVLTPAGPRLFDGINARQDVVGCANAVDPGFSL